MARLLAQSRTRNAVSIPLPSRGPSCRAGALRNAPQPPWTNPIGNWFVQQDSLALLFTPPFDKTPKDPGYIKAYPPGIRENGGQYTHGAIWSVFAHARLGQADRALEVYSLLNPINHSRTEQEARTYRVEPYVIAADVYSMPPHVGRGGWTWYTGSAGWMYRAGLEAILGVTREGSLLRDQAMHSSTTWDGFEIATQFGSTRYEIKLSRRESGADDLPPDVQRPSPGEFLISMKDEGGVRSIVLPLMAVEHRTIKERPDHRVPAIAMSYLRIALLQILAVLLVNAFALA